MKRMQRMYGWLAGTVVLAVLALGPGCATVDEAAQSPDAVIEQAVMDRLTQEMMLSRGALMASSKDGVVTLHGMVHTEAQRARALAIARSTSGVRDVVDRLRDY